jgi:hypothetical protein
VIEANFDHLVKESTDGVLSGDAEDAEEAGEEVTYGGWLAAPPAGSHTDPGHTLPETGESFGETEVPGSPPVQLPAGIVRVGLTAGHARPPPVNMLRSLPANRTTCLLRTNRGRQARRCKKAPSTSLSVAATDLAQTLESSQ